MAKRKSTSKPQADEAAALFAGERSSAAAESLPDAAADRARPGEARPVERDLSPQPAKSGRPIFTPLDDFEFPPELQLPTMEELLEPPAPGPRASPPAAPVSSGVAKAATAKLAKQADELTEAAREFDAEISDLESQIPNLRSEIPNVSSRIPAADPPGATGRPYSADLCPTGDIVAESTPPAHRSPEYRRPVAPEPEQIADLESAIPDLKHQTSNPQSAVRNPQSPPAQAAPSPPAAVSAFAGVLFIGDVHLSHRVPGFRRDDYPKVMLEKLRWAIDYARRERLLPVLLGDLFDFPRDNANWMLVELHHLLDAQTPAIYGNHDCKENSPGEHDTMSILVASGLLRLVTAEHPWVGTMNGCQVFLGGTSWGQKLPSWFDRKKVAGVADGGEPAKHYVLWATHHDLRFPGFEEAGRLDCREVPGVDLIVNGHIHRELTDVTCGRTRWINPGSLCRIARSDVTRAHSPGVLRVDVSGKGLDCRRIAVPHRSFDEVFHPDVQSEPVEVRQSLFIRDLEKLQAVRTGTGMGLREFLDANLGDFAPNVATEIRALAEEVLDVR